MMKKFYEEECDFLIEKNVVMAWTGWSDEEAQRVVQIFVGKIPEK